MSTKSTGSNASYTRHSAEYKLESLKLATQIGVAKAASNWGYMNPNSTLGANSLNMLRALAIGRQTWQ